MASSIIRFILLTFVCVTLGTIVHQESLVKAQTPTVAGPPPFVAPPENTFLVTYFHGNKRCTTCNNMEVFTRKSLDRYFEEDIQSQSMKMQVLNWQRDENAFYVMQYNLMGNAIIVSEIHNGLEKRFKNLSKIWDVAHDEKAFIEYVHKEVKSFMEAGND